MYANPCGATKCRPKADHACDWEQMPEDRIRKVQSHRATREKFKQAVKRVSFFPINHGAVQSDQVFCPDHNYQCLQKLGVQTKISARKIFLPCSVSQVCSGIRPDQGLYVARVHA